MSKWIFKALWDHKLIVEPSRRTLVPDGMGNSIMVSGGKGIDVKFTNGVLVVDDFYATGKGIFKDGKPDPERIANGIMNTRGFGSRFFLVESPEKPAAKEEIEAIEKAVAEAQKAGPQIIRGARGRSV